MQIKTAKVQNENENTKTTAAKGKHENAFVIFAQNFYFLFLVTLFST